MLIGSVPGRVERAWKQLEAIQVFVLRILHAYTDAPKPGMGTKQFRIELMHRIQEKFLATQVAFLELTEGQRNKPLTFDSAKELLEQNNASKKNHVERLIKLLELIWSTRDNVTPKELREGVRQRRRNQKPVGPNTKSRCERERGSENGSDLFNQAYHEAQCSLATVKQLYRQVLSTLSLKGSAGPQMREDAESIIPELVQGPAYTDDIHAHLMHLACIPAATPAWAEGQELPLPSWYEERKKLKTFAEDVVNMRNWQQGDPVTLLPGK
jgi:hypothetical protein